MATIEIRESRQVLRRFRRRAELLLHGRERRVLLPPRPLRLRQDDDLADDRRARAADLRPHLARRRGRHLQARLRARHRLRLPALRALSAHERARATSSFPCATVGMPRAEIAAPRRGGGADPAHRASPRPAGLRPLRRRPPTGRARPRHRAPADGLHHGRAARRARRRVPPADVRRVARPARPPQGDDRLRHARPARGDVDGRQDRRDERGRRRAVRAAARDLRPAGDAVRRRFHRLAADELHRVLEAPLSAGRSTRFASTARMQAVPELREDAPSRRARPRRAARARPPLRATAAAARRRLRRRISRHDADRHRGPTAAQAPRKRCPTGRQRVRSASRSASRSSPEKLSIFDGDGPGDRARRCTMGGGAHG